MRLIQTFVSSSFGLLIIAAPALSGATPNFPGAVQTDLELSFVPQCTLCHDGAPGKGTVTQPFGLSMRARGLVPGDAGTLSRALDALEAEGKDSNCNGTTDIEDLKGGHDPNTGAVIDGSDKPALEATTCGDGPEIPTYGCGAQIAASSAFPPGGAAAVAALLGLSLVRRRRSRPRG